MAESRITSTTINQIRTTNMARVDLKASFTNRLSHKTNQPENSIWQDVRAEAKGIMVWFIKLTKTVEKEITKWYVWNRCDFCDEGDIHDLIHYEQDTIESRYKEAFDRAMLPIDTVAAQVRGLQKSLAPLQNINITAAGMTNVYRAYNPDPNADVLRPLSDLYVLAVTGMLNRDVRITPDRLETYKIWTNNAARLATYLLPNATRIFAEVGGDTAEPWFVGEVFTGDALGDGVIRTISILTALNAQANANPVIPVGNACSLNLMNGELTVPSMADSELYLREVSGKWLLEKAEADVIRSFVADISEANATVLNGGELPKGTVVPGIVPGEGTDGWKLYWLGHNPDTAQNADETLVFLMMNEATDEVDAFRTSLNMLAGNEDPIDVSLMLFRDSASDAREEERYNVLVFDTPAGEESLFKVVTNVLDGNELLLPRPLRVMLRAFNVDGMSLPVYSMNGIVNVLADGTHGGVTLFDGDYQNTFDGSTFESDYVRIERNAQGGLDVTLKQGQPVWPEWTDTDSAETIGGDRYVRVAGTWQGEQIVTPAPTPTGWLA